MKLTINEALEQGMVASKEGKLLKAESLYRAILKTYPQHPDANHNMGVLAAAAGELKDALPFFQAALKGNEAVDQYWISYADALIKLEQFDDAKKLLRQAEKNINIREETPVYLKLKIDNLIQTKKTTSKSNIKHKSKDLHFDILDNLKLTQALRLAEGKVKTGNLEASSNISGDILAKFSRRGRSTLGLQQPGFPDREQLHELYSLYKKNNFEEALAKSKALAKQFPNNASIHNFLGAIHLKLGGLNAAKQNFSKSIRLNPLFSEAYKNLALAQKSLGESQRSHLNRMRAALSLPENSSNYLHLVNYFIENRYPERAKKLLQQKPLFKPNSMAFIWQMGLVNYQLNDYHLSVKYFDAAISKSPCNAELYINRGHSAFELENKIEAYRFYKKAVLLEPGLDLAYYNTVRSAGDFLRKDTVERLFRFSLILKPNHLETLSELSRLYGDLGEFENSLNVLKKVEILDPSHMSIFNSLICNQWLGRTKTVARIFKKLIFLKSKKVTSPQDFSVFTLRPFGRAGSLWFHSLLDGHPQISTLPGPYFQGWFSIKAKKYFNPDYTDNRWRLNLTKKILKHYEPMFNARSKKNVFSSPFGPTDWLAHHAGFTRMGVHGNEFFEADAGVFAERLLQHLTKFKTIEHTTLFELINWVFSTLNEKSNYPFKKNIFYHIHNPGIYELLNVYINYPSLKSLLIIREPIQGLESWMIQKAAEARAKLEIIDDTFKSRVASEGRRQTTLEVEAQFHINNVWSNLVSPIFSMIHHFFSLNPGQGKDTAIRLEDLKRSSRRIIPCLADWLNIEHSETMYQSTFCGQEYWGPSSTNSGRIKGFDEKPLEAKIGQFLGPNDILIFETLFWPISHSCGYTNTTQAEFESNMKKIKPWLDQPFEFEIRIFDHYMINSSRYKEVPAYLSLHNFLKHCWSTLNKNSCYPNKIVPLRPISLND